MDVGGYGSQHFTTGDTTAGNEYLSLTGRAQLVTELLLGNSDLVMAVPVQNISKLDQRTGVGSGPGRALGVAVGKAIEKTIVRMISRKQDIVE
ncbi:hypothetical protein LCGC14_2262750, partial [marine sediment metagenome]